MQEVASTLETLFEEEKSLKGTREVERTGKKTKPSDRAQTAHGRDGQDDEEEEERLGARTWEGGRKGIDRSHDEDPVQLASDSDSDSEKSKGKRRMTNN